MVWWKMLLAGCTAEFGLDDYGFGGLRHGANRIFIFHHTVRHQTADDRSSAHKTQGKDLSNNLSTLQRPILHGLPLPRDPPPPPSRPKLLQHRFQVHNIWRPIIKTIYKDPLIIAPAPPAPSVPDPDFVGAALIYPDRKGGTFAVKSRKEHKWGFKYAQTTGEVTLIKCFEEGAA
ncbi:hypothetical protein E2P81_ATG02901 [Venturia nashicola]|uniref:Uncharacterized protein n=1 Tax=Venturia nashicola TaxID=86259 RepID=A0A4Z1P6E5_9PEZI|nr:hypothetical protein E6O75_ATG02964 [Venturia nashicola]TLD36012.1 hypothetical protein E2P81_ATG02901 [Venturia nashicola]